MIFLDVKSDYSLLNSTIKIKDIVSWSETFVAMNLGKSLNGIVHFYSEVKRENKIPIFVIEHKYIDSSFLLIPKDFESYSKLLNINRKTDRDDWFLEDENIVKVVTSLGSEVELLISSEKSKNIYFAHYLKISREYIGKKVYLPKIRYIKKSDLELYSYVKSIKRKKRLNIKSDFSLETAISGYKEKYFDNLYSIVKDVKIELPTIVNYNFPNDEDRLRNILEDVIKDKEKIENREYNDYKIDRDRIDYELALIKKKRLCSYFLLVKEIIETAKELDIMIGPGRGSAVSSYVCYLLGISSVNPLKYNLIFERFLNEFRYDMPDIDIDVEHHRREELIEKVSEKYPTYKIANYSKFTEKSIEIELSRIFKSYDLKVASKMVGLICSRNIHAAGIVVSNNANSIALISNGVINLDLVEIDYLKGIKIDVLSLRSITILKALTDLSKVPLKSINLNDVRTFQSFLKSNRYIFQLESETSQLILEIVKPKSIENLADALALNRPGPLSRGIFGRYREKGTYIYQEDLISLINKRGFSLAESDMILRVILKKDKASSIKVDLDDKTSSIIEENGQFCFNKAHAVAYAHISYYFAYFRMYYSNIFRAVISENRDFRGIKLVEADINCSERYAIPYRNLVILGLEGKIGYSLSKKILSERKRGFFSNLRDVQERLNLSNEDVDILKKCSATLSFQKNLLGNVSFKIHIDISDFDTKNKRELKKFLIECEKGNIQIVIGKDNKEEILLPTKVTWSSLEILDTMFKGNVRLIPNII